MLSITEKIILSLVLILVLVGMGLSHYDELLFRHSYVVEDGLIEWLTVLGLLLCAGICIYRISILWRQKAPLFLVTLSILMCAFIFGAGEEISWGQRIFNVESNAFFKQYNAQGEINIHNLRVNGVKINKIIFAKGIALLFIIYLAVLTPLYIKKAEVRSFLDKFAFPLPQNYQIIAYIAVLLIVEGLISSSKRGEMTEFAISFIVFLNLMYPRNKEAFITSQFAIDENTT
ncbi:hypothetical protein H0A36_02615 [Endozoicomonas sp. SM1973]|uniref:Uncharacterized protein n=1 Tax=Spartinivicinus marinus TaxID=2994442 RepID=A0A853HUD9_9GAMM|nr:hypothetical protein [Spartinivicinus marinus]MCX4029874.1 hypothetical protein [Spartinivicinus marinus]NYZ64883.1 hypothetical protein [Spartinivicinus marinus]